jgi:nucleoside-diphosphate-sugar epimerase
MLITLQETRPEDFERDVVQVAIKGTTSILESALKHKTVRRVVLTSSIVAILPGKTLLAGDAHGVYDHTSRVHPAPLGPFQNVRQAYWSAKVRALEAAEHFQRQHKPHFTIVQLLPGYVVGPKELATTAKAVGDGSNLVTTPILAGKTAPSPVMMHVIGVSDTARLHVEALDEDRVKGDGVFLLDIGRPSFDEISDILARRAPELVKKGGFPLGGSQPAQEVHYDISETVRAFGPFELKSYEDDLVDLVKQLVELQGASTV